MAEDKQRFARHLAELDPQRLTESARDYLRLVFDDTVACMIGGLREPSVLRLAARIPPGPAVEPLTKATGSPEAIALLLGTAGAVLEFDEGNYAAGGHPAVVAAAAALAAGAHLEAEAPERLAAFLAGYEAGARVGHAADMRPSAHRHSAWGVVGAAVAAARIRHFTVDQIAAVVDMAAGLTIAASAGAARAGADIRNVAIGAAARQGILACDLVEAGMTPQGDALEWMFGRVLGERFDLQHLVANLPGRLLFQENFLKVHAACRETLGAIDAYDVARGDRPLSTGEVRYIEIEAYAEAARLDERYPANAVAARFSIPAVLSEFMLRGSLGTDAFSAHQLLETPLRDLMDRIAVREDAGLTALFPAERRIRCYIHLHDGAVMTGEVDQRGQRFDGPEFRDRIERKIHALRGHSD